MDDKNPPSVRPTEHAIQTATRSLVEQLDGGIVLSTVEEGGETRIFAIRFGNELAVSKLLEMAFRGQIPIQKVGKLDQNLIVGFSSEEFDREDSAQDG